MSETTAQLILTELGWIKSIALYWSIIYSITVIFNSDITKGFLKGVLGK